MTPIRTLSICAIVALVGAAVTSCIEPPNYPDEPSIEFKSIQSQRVDKITGTYDTITVSVNFKDGNGDLGLSSDEKNPPYSDRDSQGKVNIFKDNYFFEPQIYNESSKAFEPIALPNPDNNYNSRFPRLAPDNRSAPLKGTLSFGQKFFVGTFPPGATVRFQVSIADRALHVSNKVTTDPIIIPR
ncbi:hypothetical protein [Hymenobacter sp. BT491]|uniref:hypothetical protein n=1 Tax=Hymenobacter sp. BT491 TaxID=2766779 RepID=UPI001653C658|nr:hypothetical protein [Hymenobacter sp. BT491]MBC6989084.1 hypothetical protein [Hymenobacter sp. BT491]